MSAEHAIAVLERGASIDFQNALIVLVAMAYLADDDGVCSESAAVVAERAGVSAITVRRLWASLIVAGDLVLVESAAGRRPPTHQVARATRAPYEPRVRATRTQDAHPTASRVRTRASLTPTELPLPTVAAANGKRRRAASPARALRTNEASARTIAEAVWTLCGDGPKPVVAGNGNAFMACVRIAEQQLDAGNDADALPALMFAAHQEATISTAAVNMQRTKRKRGGRADTPSAARTWLTKQQQPQQQEDR